MTRLRFVRLACAWLSGVALSLGAALWLAGPTTQAAPACQRYVVSPGGSDLSDCSDAAHPCRTVQQALRRAATGDVICVADNTIAPGPSVYTGTFVITQSVTLDGAWQATCVDPHNLTCSFTAVKCAPEAVVLDAQGTGRVIHIAGKITPTVRCFTITGGDAAGLGGDPGTTIENDAGGGIYSRDAAPVILSNIITGNYGCDLCPGSYGRGGGLYLLNAPATALVSGNTIVHNVADNSSWGEGGGLMLRDSSAQVRNNTIAQNRAGLSAGDGGGIALVNSYPVLDSNQILTNVAGQSVRGLGGGIFIWVTDRPAVPTVFTVTRNLLRGNWALNGSGSPGLISRGGGLYYNGLASVTPFINDNVVDSNVAALAAPGEGGGLYLRGLEAAALISDNTVEGNVAGFNTDGAGGGFYLESGQGQVVGNRVVKNTASPGGTLGQGGGFYINGGGGLLKTNSVLGNLALVGATTGTGYGGGIAISNSVVTVQDNWIEQNAGATAPHAVSAGGGLYVYQGAPRLTNNVLLSNTAGGNTGLGGGLYAETAVIVADGNMVIANQAAGTVSGRGGGIRLNQCTAFTLTNNIIARNVVSTTGSGIAIFGGPAASGGCALAHNTVAGNRGGDGTGVQVSTLTMTLYNNLIVSHTLGISNATPASVIYAHFTLFEGNGLNYSSGVTSLNPVAGPAGLLPDYHLAVGSGAVDHATPLAWVSRDIDGDVRPIGPASDVGADERRVEVYLPVVLRNF